MSDKGVTLYPKLSTGIDNPELIAVPFMLIAAMPVGASIAKQMVFLDSEKFV